MPDLLIYIGSVILNVAALVILNVVALVILSGSEGSGTEHSS